MADLLITPRLTEKSYKLPTEGINVSAVPVSANKYKIKKLINDK